MSTQLSHEVTFTIFTTDFCICQVPVLVKKNMSYSKVPNFLDRFVNLTVFCTFFPKASPWNRYRDYLNHRKDNEECLTNICLQKHMWIFCVLNTCGLQHPLQFMTVSQEPIQYPCPDLESSQNKLTPTCLRVPQLLYGTLNITSVDVIFGLQ